MTDSTARPAGAFDKALVEQTHHEKRSIWLPALAAHHINAGQPIIDGKTFTDCVIEGPAILAALDGVLFDSCAMGMTTAPENLIMRGQGDKLVGVVPFSNTTFVRCRFIGVGYTGSEVFIQSVIDALAPHLADQDQTA